MILRVFVLALDGLEYKLVKRWRLMNLLQSYHGVFKIQRQYFITGPLKWANYRIIASPYTPIIWTSFLTGKEPRDHGVKELRTYVKIPEVLRYLKVIHRVKKVINGVLGLGLGRLLGILPPFIVDKRDIPYPTIFDVVKNSIAVWFICYNEPSWIFNMISNTLKSDLAKVPKVLGRIYKLRKRKVFKNIHANWKLFGAYFEIADILGHLYIVKRPLVMLRVYLELNRLVKGLKSNMPDDTAFIIVSDHGMRPSPDKIWGIHSNHAFWSSNVRLPFKPRDHTDFFYLILELLDN